MTNTPTTDVPRVRDLLDSGELLAYMDSEDLTGNVAEALIVDRALGRQIAAKTDDEVAAEYQVLADRLGAAGFEVSDLPAQCRFELTLANVLRQIIDEDLVDEVVGVLGGDTVAHHLDQLASEQGREWVCEVERRDAYRCSVTGELRTGAVVVIQPRWALDREATDGAALPVLISPDVLVGLGLGGDTNG